MGGDELSLVGYGEGRSGKACSLNSLAQNVEGPREPLLLVFVGRAAALLVDCGERLQRSP